MKLLELFSGTGSVGRVARAHGWDVLSLDLKNADINADIQTWDYKQFEPKHFDFIWASPPCTEYSLAKTTAPRNIPAANKIVEKTWEIIDYLKPTYFVLENPQTGYLKKQDFMQGRYFVDLDYCKYGMPYRKRTRLWNNIFHWIPRPLCAKDCGNIVNNKHVRTAQRVPSGPQDSRYTQDELYVIPEPLIQEIFENIHAWDPILHPNVR